MIAKEKALEEKKEQLKTETMTLKTKNAALLRYQQQHHDEVSAAQEPLSLVSQSMYRLQCMNHRLS